MHPYLPDMKQIWIGRAGGYEALEVREARDPTPAPGELVIDVKAIGVNFADVLARMGRYPDAPPIPCVIGYEVAGVVAEVGADVTTRGETADRFVAGDRVFALTRFGGYATRVAVPANQVFRIPEGRSFAEAAAIPVNYFTASLAVNRFGNAQPDERVLVHNAGGGVGIAAVQLARRAGAMVFGTCSSWKHDRVREQGAHHLIDYRTTGWVEPLLSATDGKGVHLIVDPIGGSNLARDLEVLAPLGRLVAYGLSEPVRNGGRPLLATLRSVFRMPRPHFLSLLNHNRSIGGLNLGRLWGEIDRLRGVACMVIDAWSNGEVSPVVWAEVPFDSAAEAHRILEERRNVGKVIIVS